MQICGKFWDTQYIEEAIGGGEYDHSTGNFLGNDIVC